MIRAAFLLVMFLCLALPLGIWWFVHHSLPQLSGVVSLSELTEPVAVQFDGRGVPYIEARSDADLYLIQGYITACDRMFQMDMLRRLAEGELSEVFGPGTVVSDKLTRTIGIARLAESELKVLSPSAKASLEAYCRGVNFYLFSHFRKLPLEFWLLGYKPKPWTAQDSVAIWKYLTYELDQSWKLDDLRGRVASKVGSQDAATLFAEDLAASSRTVTHTPRLRQTLLNELDKIAGFTHAFVPNLGSSSWVVAGKKSVSGGALLACDKHTSFSQPDYFYLLSLSSPVVHVAGASVPGIPGIALGRNKDIAWGSAGLKADVQDLFLEEFSSRFPNQYKTPSGWQNVTELSEVIPVRFAKDLVHKVVVTRHGPVLVRYGNTGVALSWSGTQTAKSALNSLWQLNRACRWEDFLEALKEFPGPPQVFTYADRLGNIGYQAAGGVPLRAQAGEGTAMVPGWEAKGEWTGTIPFANLPYAFNPEEGFLVYANQKLSSKSSVTASGHFWGAPYRCLRATLQLMGYNTRGERVGLPDMNDLQADDWSYLSTLVKREIREAIARTELIDRIQLQAMDLLAHWDGHLKPESAGAAIYESFLRTLAKRLLEPKLGYELSRQYLNEWPLWPTLVEWYLNNKPEHWLPPQERTHCTFVLTTFGQALKDLRLTFNNDDPRKWSWQAIHRATFPHIATQGLPWLSFIFNIGPVGVGGDETALNACDATFGGVPGQFQSKSGPTMRLLVDLADSDKFYQTTSLGQSGQLFSPFQKDQLKPWLQVDPMPIAFSVSQIEQQSQYKLVFSPKTH